MTGSLTTMRELGLLISSSDSELQTFSMRILMFPEMKFCSYLVPFKEQSILFAPEKSLGLISCWTGEILDHSLPSQGQKLFDLERNICSHWVSVSFLPGLPGVRKLTVFCCPYLLFCKYSTRPVYLKSNYRPDLSDWGWRCPNKTLWKQVAGRISSVDHCFSTIFKGKYNLLHQVVQRIALTKICECLIESLMLKFSFFFAWAQ